MEMPIIIRKQIVDCEKHIANKSEVIKLQIKNRELRNDETN